MNAEGLSGPGATGQLGQLASEVLYAGLDDWVSLARVDGSGNETAVGSPAPITVAASEPPPSGLNEFIYEPMSVAQLCATLGPGDYHARILAADGTVLAYGHFSVAP